MTFIGKSTFSCIFHTVQKSYLIGTVSSICFCWFWLSSLVICSFLVLMLSGGAVTLGVNFLGVGFWLFLYNIKLIPLSYNISYCRALFGALEHLLEQPNYIPLCGRKTPSRAAAVASCCRHSLVFGTLLALDDKAIIA